MRLDLIRLVLNPESNLFGFAGNREEWLRLAFSDPFAFTHRKQLYHYVPVHPDPQATESILSGRVGREISVRENEPPEAGLETVTRDAWTAARVFIDPRSHEDGQKVAFEATSVGVPLSVLRSLVEHVNKRVDVSYRIVPNPILSADSFREFLRSHPTDVVLVQFTLNAPNMFSDKSNVDEEMRAARDKLKAKKARITLASDQGMTLENPIIHQLAEYAAQGGGEIKAKTADNDGFSSRSKIENVNIDEPEGEDDKTILDMLKGLIFKK